MNIQKSPIKGMHGWVIVALVILLIDIFAKPDETLTAACHRALKRKPVTVAGLITLTTLHLIAGSGPYRRVDIYQAVEILRGWTSGQLS